MKIEKGLKYTKMTTPFSIGNNDSNSKNQKNFFCSKICTHILNINFVFLEEKIELHLNKNSTFTQIVNELINKINENKLLYQKCHIILEKRDKLIFIYENNLLDRTKSLEDNNISNNASIIISLEQ